MADDRAAALERIARDVENQVRLLFDAFSRPGVDRNNVARSALDLILQSCATHLGHVAGLEDVAAQIKELKTRFIEVDHYLGDLQREWRCRACQSKVASGAAIHGDPASPAVMLVCERCGGETAVSEAGRAVFDGVFGHLVGPDWRPSINGFKHGP